MGEGGFAGCYVFFVGGVAEGEVKHRGRVTTAPYPRVTVKVTPTIDGVAVGLCFCVDEAV